MVPLSVPAGTPRGECDLAFISGCVRFLRVNVEGNHIVLGRLQVRRAGSASRWFAVALTAATVAACAQAPVVANKPSSFDTGRHASVATKKRTPAAEDKTDPQNAEAAGASYGLASFYGHQTRTASGEKFNPHELTAAHRTLPFGTRVRVTDVSTGRSVTVRVNDNVMFSVYGVLYFGSNATTFVARL